MEPQAYTTGYTDRALVHILARQGLAPGQESNGNSRREPAVLASGATERNVWPLVLIGAAAVAFFTYKLCGR